MADLVLKGDVQLKRRLAALARKSPHAAGRALFEEGERIMTASKQIVPVDSGALRSSGQTHAPDVKGSSVEVILGYGSAAADYAVPVHEIPPPPGRSVGGRSARHNPPTQWKYLETPFKVAVRGMAARLARVLRRELR